MRYILVDPHSRTVTGATDPRLDTEPRPLGKGHGTWAGQAVIQHCHGAAADGQCTGRFRHAAKGIPPPDYRDVRHGEEMLAEVAARRGKGGF